MRSLVNAFSSPNIPPEILATLLNLVRFLKFHQFFLSIFLCNIEKLRILEIFSFLPSCLHEVQHDIASSTDMYTWSLLDKDLETLMGRALGNGFEKILPFLC